MGRIALVSCEPMPAVEDDEGPLRQALADRGYSVDDPAWDAPDVDWAGYAGCLLRTPWDYQERQPAFVAWAERVARVAPLYHGPAVVRWNTDKRYLRDLAGDGAPLAPTVWLDVGQAPDLARIMTSRGWRRGFIKPQIGATARETLRFDADAAGLARATAHVARLLPREGLMLQPYLESVEREGELSAVFIDGALTHGVRKVPVAGDYRVQDDFGAFDEPYAFAPDEAGLAAHILALAQRRFVEPFLYARVDFLRDASGALRLNELELVEPSLFFRHGPHAAERLADALVTRLGDRSGPGRAVGA